MTTPCRIPIAVAFAVCIAGCATGTSTVPSAVVTPVRTKLIAADRMKDALVIGKSTKADVIASLGETLAISFDSGFEVWVYRLARETPAQAASARRIARSGSKSAAPELTAEFVILFAPSGVVAKTRVRPPGAGASPPRPSLGCACERFNDRTA